MTTRQALLLVGTFAILCGPALAVVGEVEEKGPSASADDWGRQLYQDGTSPDGEDPVAVMGDAEIEVPASAIPCGGCHGPDGRGRPEGGISPSDITWPSLTDPRGGQSASGRRYPPYDETDLIRAITMGVDPAGNELDVAMPRYRLSKPDAEALVAYIRDLGSEPEVGVSAEAVTIGVLLPPPELGEVAAAVEATLSDVFGRVTGEGGTYGRRLELVVERIGRPGGSGETPEATRERLAAFLDREEPFALVAPFFEGAQAELTTLAEERKVPVIGPLTTEPELDRPPPRYVFYLLSGAEEQARALAGAAAARLPRGLARWAVLAPERPTAEVEIALRGLELQAGSLRLPAPSLVRYRPGAFDAAALVARLREHEVEHLFMLGGGLEITRFLAEAARSGWAPEVYLPTSSAVRALLDGAASRSGFRGAVRMAFPLLPRAAGATPEERREIDRILADHDLPQSQTTTVQRTLAAARLLIEGVRRAGHRPTREGLVDQLETLYSYRTGLVPPLTYHPNRRIGALGAYLVTYDAVADSLDPSDGWQALSVD